MKRKLLSVLLCFCMALTLVPAALAAGPEDGPETQEFPEWDVMPMALDMDDASTDMAVPFSLNAEAAPAPLADEAAAPTDPIVEALGNVTVSGGVFTLNSSVTLTKALTISGMVVIDLNGQTITCASSGNGVVIEPNGSLTIRDSKATAPSVASTDYAVSYTGGQLTSPAAASNSSTVYIKAGGMLRVESGKINSEHGNAIGTMNGKNFTEGDTSSPCVIVTGGYVSGQEAGICAMRNANVQITGGVFEGRDNNAIGANGSKDANGQPTQGNVSISLTGGTLIGRIVSSGYASCAVYLPTSGSLTIGGDVQIISTNGPGVVLRGGSAAFTVTGGSVIANGTTSGKIGDFRSSVTCAAVVLDATATYYPDNANTRIQIAGGDFTADPSVPVVLFAKTNSGTATETQEFAITGGKFSSDPFDAENAQIKTGIAKPEGYKYDETSRTVVPDVTQATVTFAVDDSTSALLEGDSKTASDLFTGSAALKDGAVCTVTGTAKYIKDWTAFHGSDVSEQNGNYLPLKITVTPSGSDSTKKAADLVSQVIVRGSGEKTFEGSEFFGEGNDGVNIMLLNKLVGNSGLDDSSFEVTIVWKEDTEVAQTDGQTKAASASTTYTVNCKGVTLELPKMPEAAADGSLDLSETKDKVSADITNTINAAKAPNATQAPTEGGSADVDDAKKEVTITLTGSTVTLPKEISGALQSGQTSGVDVSLEVKGEHATVTLSAGAVAKLSGSENSVIKTEKKEAGSLTVSGDDQTGTIKSAIDSAVDVTATANSANLFAEGSTEAETIGISMKVTKSGNYFVLYLGADKTEKMTASPVAAVQQEDGSYVVPFKTKHLSTYAAVEATEEVTKLLSAAPSSPDAPAEERVPGVSYAKDLTNTILGGKVTLTGTTAGRWYVIQIHKGDSYVAMIEKAEGTSLSFNAQEGAILEIWECTTQDEPTPAQLKTARKVVDNWTIAPAN